MNTVQHDLSVRALKSAISAAAGMILSLNIVDPEHFSFQTFGGWKHVLEAIGIVVVVAEARFWKQWADSRNGNGGQEEEKK